MILFEEGFDKEAGFKEEVHKWGPQKRIDVAERLVNADLKVVERRISLKNKARDAYENRVIWGGMSPDASEKIFKRDLDNIRAKTNRMSVRIARNQKILADTPYARSTFPKIPRALKYGLGGAAVGIPLAAGAGYAGYKYYKGRKPRPKTRRLK